MQMGSCRVLLVCNLEGGGIMQGLRVEVNGQVLSKGGNVGADQVMDTTAESVDRCVSLR